MSDHPILCEHCKNSSFQSIQVSDDLKLRISEEYSIYKKGKAIISQLLTDKLINDEKGGIDSIILTKKGEVIILENLEQLKPFYKTHSKKDREYQIYDYIDVKFGYVKSGYCVEKEKVEQKKST